MQSKTKFQSTPARETSNVTPEISAWARRMAALRKTHAGGRPKVLRKCKQCGAKLGAREMRAHRCLS